MMESASLRIKFTPFIKKIASGNPGSKCCIEIVPEVSCFNNLDKINWTLDNNALEYNIPMTYKIIIKKQDPLHGRENKIYHSCVDLLHSCSLSNTEFASGDVSRIISDNFFLRRVTPQTDGYDYVLTKDLMNYKELYEKLMGRKTASIQTVNINEPYSSLSSHRPLVDKALEINIQAETIISNVTVSHTEDTHFEAGDMKSNDNQNMYDPLNQNEEIIVNNDSTNSIDALIEEFTVNAAQRKLSLSPICSVNTNDMLPTGIVYNKSNTSTYVFKLCHTVSKTNVHSDDHGYNRCNSQQFLPYNSSRILKIYESLTNVANDAVKNMININKSTKENVKPKKAQSYPKNDTNTPVLKISSAIQNDSNDHMHDNIRNACNNYDRVLAENELTFNNIMNTMNQLHENRHKEYNRILKLRSKVYGEEKAITYDCDARQENKEDCKIVCKQEGNCGRVLPEVRVANFIQNLEKEIYPLKRMLNEIKYKCAMMGLCCGDLIPKQKSIIYKSISNYDSIKDPRKIKSKMGKNSIATRLAQSLSFEVEATPQENVVECRNARNVTPVNVKIRVRKREDGPYIRNGYLSVPNADEPDTAPQRIRLASSDHTIMSFNLVMEADHLSPDRKARRKFFGFCLGTQEDDDDSQYLPSTTKDMGSSSDTRIFTSKSPLSKNADAISTSSSKKHKKLFGKCKPGGCLDPPLDEEKYIYKPIIVPDTKPMETEPKKSERDSISKSQEEPIIKDVFFHGNEGKCKLNDDKKHRRKSSHDSYIDQKRKKYRASNDSVINQRKKDSSIIADSDSIITYPPTPSDHEIYNKDTIRRNSSRNATQDEYREKYYIPPLKIPIEIDKNRITDANDKEESKIKKDRRNESLNKRNSKESENQVESKSIPKMKKLRSRKIPGSVYSETDRDIASQNFEGVDNYNILRTGGKSGDLPPTNKEMTMIDIHVDKREVVNKESSDSTTTKKKIIPTDIPRKKTEDVDELIHLSEKRDFDKAVSKEKHSRDPSPTTKIRKLANITAEEYEDINENYSIPSEKISRVSSPSKKKLPSEKHEDFNKDVQRGNHSRDTSPTKKIKLANVTAEGYEDTDESGEDFKKHIRQEKRSRDSSPTKNRRNPENITAEGYKNMDENYIFPSEKKSRDPSPTKKKLPSEKIKDKDVIVPREKLSRDSSPTKNTKLANVTAEGYEDTDENDEDFNKEVRREKPSRDSSPTKKIRKPANVKAEGYEDMDVNDEDFNKDVRQEKRSRDSSPTKKIRKPANVTAEGYKNIDENYIIPSEKNSRDPSPTKKKLPSEKIKDKDVIIPRQKLSRDSSPTKNIKLANVTAEGYEDTDENYEDFNKEFRREKRSRDSSPTKKIRKPANVTAEGYKNIDENYIIPSEKNSRDPSPTKKKLSSEKIKDKDVIIPRQNFSRDPSPTKNIKLANVTAEGYEDTDENDEDFNKEVKREKPSRDSSPTKKIRKPANITAEGYKDMDKNDIIPSEKISRDSSPTKRKLPSEKHEDFNKDVRREKLSRDLSPTKKIRKPTNVTAEGYEDMEGNDDDYNKGARRGKRSRDSSPTKNIRKPENVTAEGYEDMGVNDEDFNKDIRREKRSRDSSPIKKIKLANVTAEGYEDTDESGEDFKKHIRQEKRSRDSSPTKNRRNPENITAEGYKNMDENYIFPSEKKSRDPSPTKKKLPSEKIKDKDVIVPREKLSRDSSPTKNTKLANVTAEGYEDTDENDEDFNKEVRREKPSRDSSPTKKIRKPANVKAEGYEDMDVNDEDFNKDVRQEKRSRDSSPTKKIRKPANVTAEGYKNIDENYIIPSEKNSRDPSPTKKKLPSEKIKDKDVIIPRQKLSRDSSPTKNIKLANVTAEGYEDTDENYEDFNKEFRREKRSRDSSPTKKIRKPANITAEGYKDMDKNDIIPSEKISRDSSPTKRKLPSEKHEDFNKDVRREKLSRDLSPTKKIRKPTNVTAEGYEDMEGNDDDYNKGARRGKRSRDSSPTKNIRKPENVTAEGYEDMGVNDEDFNKDIRREKRSRDSSPIKKIRKATNVTPDGYSSSYEDMDVNDKDFNKDRREKRSRDSSPTKKIRKLANISPEDMDEIDIIPSEKISRDSSPSKKKLITDILRQKSDDMDDLIIPSEKRSRDSSPTKKKLPTEENEDFDKDVKRENLSRDSSPTKKIRKLANSLPADMDENYIIPSEKISRDSSPSKKKLPTDILRQKGDDMDEVIIPSQKRSRDSSPTKKKLSTEDKYVTIPREKHSRDSSPTKRNIIPTDIPRQKSDDMDKVLIPAEKRSRETSPTKKKLPTDKNEDVREKHSRDSSPTKKVLISTEKYENPDNEFFISPTEGENKPTDIPDYRDYYVKDDTHTQKIKSDEDVILQKSRDLSPKNKKLKSEDIPGLVYSDNYIKDLSQATSNIESAAGQKHSTAIETVYLAPHKDARSEKSDVTPKLSEAATILDLENSDENILFQISHEADTGSKPEANLEINDKKGDPKPDTKSDISNESQGAIIRKDIAVKEGASIVTEDKYDYNENVSFIQDSSDAQQDMSYVQDSSDAQHDSLSNKSERSEDTATAFNVEDLDRDGFEENEESKFHDKNYKPSQVVSVLHKDNKLDNENIRNNDAVLVSRAENIYEPPLKDQTFIKDRILQDDDINNEDTDYKKYTEKYIEDVKDRDHSSPTRDERRSLTRSPIIGIAISPTGQVMREVNEKLLESIHGSHSKDNVAVVPFESSKYDDIGVIDGTWNKKPSSEDKVSSNTKDSIFLNLAFQTYFDENQLVVKTLDSSVDTDKQNVTFVKSLFRPSNKSIAVPIDSNHMMTIEINPSTQNERKSKIPKPISKHDTGKSGSVSGGSLKEISSNLQLILSSIHDQDLAPLQEIIKELKKDIDQLADQQILFREKLGPGPRRMRPQVQNLVQIPSTKCSCMKRY